jgi:inorganic triphosphatase YgiF
MGLFERGEWDHPVEGDRPDLSFLAQTPLAALAVGADQLKPMVRVHVVRRTAKVSFAPDGQIELALDIGKVEAGGRTEDFCELELERLTGPTRTLFDLALSMSAKTRLWPSAQSKADRGFRLLANQPPSPMKAESRLNLSGHTVGQALSALIKESLSQILHNGALVLKDREVEALHQIRVALRRLRAAMGLFKPVVVNEAFLDMRGRLREMSQIMGRARDLDVLITRIETMARPSPRLQDALIEDRGVAYDEVCRVLGSHDFGHLTLTIMAWAECGDWRQDAWPHSDLRDQPVVVFADQALERLRHKLKRDGEGLAKLPATAQHRVRIRSKNLRYGMEFFGSLYPDRASGRRHLIGAVKQVQDRLGIMNDRSVGEALLRVHAQGPCAFDAGQALANLSQGQADAAVRAEQALKAALSLPRFWTRP